MDLRPGQLWVRAARAADVRAAGRLAVHLDGHAVVLFAWDDRLYAVDNRCPHMGFPLDRGTVADGILTCHWHHARFDLAGGGTFDQFADDVRAYPVDERDGDVYVDLSPRGDPRAHHRRRLRDGLERDIPLVIAKAALVLAGDGAGSRIPPGGDLRPRDRPTPDGAGSRIPPGGDLGPRGRPASEGTTEAVRVGLEFGTKYRAGGWGQGLTILTCYANLLPHLAETDRAWALYQGLSAVARDTAGVAPRFALAPLPDSGVEIERLAAWFRRFVEVRDAEGAERCIVSAVRAGADGAALARMLFAAATDHRFIDIGHVLDFTNKAFEALDLTGWAQAEPALASLATPYATADRMEESNEWRHPIDLVTIVETAAGALPAALEQGARRRDEDGGADGRRTPAARGRVALAPVLLGDDPQAIADALLEALRDGIDPADLAAAVAYAAALRIARFPPSNEFSDWDTALHTFTFANAVEQGLRRSGSVPLLRGVFDAAMSVYLDRFLNVPPARLPDPDPEAPRDILRELAGTLDRQQQTAAAARLVTTYLSRGDDVPGLLAALGHLLVREDRNFHTIQMVEAAVRQHAGLTGTAAGTHVLVAAVRYLAAHAPTVRAQGQTFEIARRLHRGERLFEEEE
ncbi:MAG TPA: Rieske (2Fe-2S) protein [bacterium]|nr:Rieske (2Fe-2S) protein [bacterium]